jgi:hypothetical protein
VGWVRGDKLSPKLRAEVLARFLYRWTHSNPNRERVWRGLSSRPTTLLISDEEWLRRYCFRVTRKGELDRRVTHASPDYAEEG